jgi:uncharacterized 2Fe-2S/4Fe-4S cluster protein (DUF4445 family)
VDFDNSSILPKQMLDEGLVLICRTRLMDVAVCVDTFTNIEKEQGKFSKMSEDILLVDKDLLPTPWDFEPIVKEALLDVPQPVMGDGLSDFDRFRRAVFARLGGNQIDLPLPLLKKLPVILRETDGKLALSYHFQSDILRITALDSPECFSAHYGIAVDIGTTTIAVKLVDMKQGDIISSKTDYNKQIECGLDVISRINYARKPERLEELRIKVLETINRLIGELAGLNGIDPDRITSASIAGNTTMVHLLLGIIPEYIRLEPYTPAVYQVPLFNASELGLAVSPFTPVHIAPSVGSYLGGDITSGILCTSLATHSSDVCLFIDIGTNGELVLGNEDFLLGCACSAGPAFEGGSIENGMRASLGAIERVEINKETGLPVYSTIGAVPPAGICGSGIISLVAGLLKTGWIDPAGKLDRARPCRAIDASAKNARYIIAPPEDSPSGKAIFVTESDIDNLIRAKAAIFSACRVMLQSVSMDFGDLSKVYIAGGFGRYLDIDKAKTIGLIPDLPAGTFDFIGNSSMIGAYMTLLSKRHREKQQELAGKITYLDLSTEAGYMDQYTAALFLPHTDRNLFRDITERNKKGNS